MSTVRARAMSPRSDGPADPVARRSPRLCRFFAGVMRRQMAQNFRAVRLSRGGLDAVPAGRPLVVVANHPSWWDPAFFIVLAGALFDGRESYGPIDAGMLARYRFMGRIGLFGLDADPRRGAAQFLRVGGAIAADPRRMLWVTGQGDFADPRLRPVALKGGVARLMLRRPDLVALPLAVEYPFWSEKRPEALARFGDPLECRAGEDADTLNVRLEAGLGGTMDDLARDAMARDPARFERLMTGAKGVGGVYGAWGRLSAALRGRRYTPEHMEET